MSQVPQSKRVAAKKNRSKKVKEALNKIPVPQTIQVKPSKQKKERVLNTEESSIAKSGLCISSTKVKSVIMQMALNVNEYAAMRDVFEAEHGTKQPKPTKEHPDPPKTAVVQKDVSKISGPSKDVIARAESHHAQLLKHAYELEKIKSIPDYHKHLREAKVKHFEESKKSEESKKKPFNLEKYHKKTYKDFYDGFEDYKINHDTYYLHKVNEEGYKLDSKDQVIMRKNEPSKQKHNQWSRAKGLINKLCYRLSLQSRYIIASFLDHMVEQYARNGFLNCLAEDKVVMKARHVVMRSPDFSKIVTLDKFVRTFDIHANVMQWATTEVANKEDATSMPQYGFEHKFNGYVNEICRGVKLQLAAETGNDKYKSMSVSGDVKVLLSEFVVEATARLGNFLRAHLENVSVKTINDSTTKYVLKQLYSVCGVDGYDTLMKSISDRLAVHAAWLKKRADARKKTGIEYFKKKQSVDASEEEESADEDDDQ